MSAPIVSTEPPASLEAQQGRRYLIVLGVVGTWMLAGFIFRLPQPIYQLAGIPLLFVFQRCIARRPISELWFKEPLCQSLRWWSYVLVAGFMIVPLAGLRHANEWGPIWVTMMICAAAGAIPLGISVARFPRSALKPLLACWATAGVLGPIILLGGRRLSFTGLHLASPTGLFAALQYFLLSLTAWFVVEEVFFRGGMDSFLHRPNDRHPWASAAFVSLLWGLWHLPFYSRDWAASGRDHLFLNCLLCPLVGVLLGIPLSLCWRRSGLLLVPALVHAFINAVPHVWSAP